MYNENGEWQGSAVGEVVHWKDRALTAEAHVRELVPVSWRFVTPDGRTIEVEAVRWCTARDEAARRLGVVPESLRYSREKAWIS